LIVGWCGRFLFFVGPRQFSKVVGEWPENQILIPDWIYFHCPGTTLLIKPNFLATHHSEQVRCGPNAPRHRPHGAGGTPPLGIFFPLPLLLL